MSNTGKKPGEYCKLSVYLKYNAPTLLDNIEDLCMYNSLNPRGKNNGVTFLLPDSQNIKKINNLVGSDTKTAVKMIQACILPIYLESISDFKRNESNISNLMKNKLPIESVGLNKVVLENKSSITVEPGFKHLHADSRRINLFKLSGDIPLGSEHIDGNGKSGGYTGGSLHSSSNIKKTKTSTGDWPFYISMAKKDLELFIKSDLHGEVLNPLSQLEAELYKFCKDHGKNDVTQIMEKTSCGAVTDFLFDGALLTNTERKDMFNSNLIYSNNEVLDDLLKSGCNAKYYDELSKSKGLILNSSLNPTNMETVFEDLFDKQTKIINISSAISSRFDTEENFRDWWMAKCEFAFLYSVKFINSWKAGKLGDITKMCHVYHNHYCVHLCPSASDCKMGSSVKKARVLTGPISGRSFAMKEMFCTRVSFLVDVVCCSGGFSGGMNNLSGYIGKARESYDGKPNKKTTSTFYHLIEGKINSSG